MSEQTRILHVRNSGPGAVYVGRARVTPAALAHALHGGRRKSTGVAHPHVACFPWQSKPHRPVLEPVRARG
jgi:hypothetical protein